MFLETTVLLGFLIHGELVLMVGGLAASRGDAALVPMIALAWAAAVAGDVVSLLLGRRLGRPFLERRGERLRLGASRVARVDRSSSAMAARRCSSGGSPASSVVAGSFAATGAVATGVGSAVIVLAAAGLLLRARFARTTIEEPAA